MKQESKTEAKDIKKKQAECEASLWNKCQLTGMTTTKA